MTAFPQINPDRPLMARRRLAQFARSRLRTDEQQKQIRVVECAIKSHAGNRGTKEEEKSRAHVDAEIAKLQALTE